MDDHISSIVINMMKATTVMSFETILCMVVITIICTGVLYGLGPG